MGRFSPQVLPTVTRDPFDAGFSGLLQGYGLGTEFAERGRRHKREEAEDKRAEKYVGIQEENTRLNRIGRQIDQARSGYYDADPTDDIPGSINFERSEGGQRFRAENDRWDTRTADERGYQERIRQDERDYQSQFRGPVPGSEEWKAMERFKTNEQIRQSRGEGRYSYRTSSGASADPNVRRQSLIGQAIDDDRALMGVLQKKINDYPQYPESPSDTAGIGQDRRELSSVAQRMAALTKERQNYLFGLQDAPPVSGSPMDERPPASAQSWRMTPERLEAEEAIKRIAASNLPPAEKQRRMAEVINRMNKP